MRIIQSLADSVRRLAPSGSRASRQIEQKADLVMNVSGPRSALPQSVMYQGQFILALALTAIFFAVIVFFTDRITTFAAGAVVLFAWGLLVFLQYRFIWHVSNAVPDILFICELKTLRSLYVNKDAGEVLGYSELEMNQFGEDVLNRALHPDDKALFDGLRDKLRSRERKVLEFECRMRDAAGEWRWLSCRVVAFGRSSDGEPTQCLGVARDISALKTANNKAAKLEQVALEKQRMVMLGELSASVAHEVRNPIQGLLNCIDELRERLDPEGKDATISLLYEGIQRMDHISERLLRFSRTQDSAMQPSDVAKCIEGTCAFVRSRALKCQVQLVIEIEPGLPQVNMNPERISEALLNLINNAIDACTPAGTVTISASLEKPDRDKLELRVSDNGCGIAPDAREKVFDIFYTTKPAGKGTGLGMAIVKKNIEAQGGHVELLTTSNQGTTFRILIPLRQQPSSDRHGQTGIALNEQSSYLGRG